MIDELERAIGGMDRNEAGYGVNNQPKTLGAETHSVFCGASRGGGSSWDCLPVYDSPRTAGLQARVAESGEMPTHSAWPRARIHS